MKVIRTALLFPLILLTACSSDPNEWTEERKQVILDKCDKETFDCDCYLKVTMEMFPNAQEYNTTMEDEESNADKVDAYWEKVYECMNE